MLFVLNLKTDRPRRRARREGAYIGEVHWEP